jgi:hypothetical protein
MANKEKINKRKFNIDDLIDCRLKKFNLVTDVQIIEVRVQSKIKK